MCISCWEVRKHLEVEIMNKLFELIFWLKIAQVFQANDIKSYDEIVGEEEPAD
jgi:hypothetical protein